MNALNEPTNALLTAAIYLRISADNDDKTPKVEEQHERICTQLVPGTYEVVAVLKDPGVSAWAGSDKPRHDWERLKQLVRERRVTTILFDRQDRLSRDDAETWEFMALCKRNAVRWHAVEGGQLDFANRADAMRAFWEGSEANAYSDKISQNTRRKYKTDREKGLPYAHGPRPFGRETDHMTERPPEGDLIRLARDMLLNEGMSLFAVMKSWQAADSTTPRGNAWTASAVRHAMRKWSNAAVPSYMDEPLDSVQAHPAWTPIISRQDAEEIRALLALRSRPGTGVTTLCGGIIRCRCGAPMLGGGWQGRNSGQRIYRCSFYGDNKINITNTKGQHSTVARHLADRAAREAVVDTYFIKPRASTAATGEAARLADMQTELTKIQEKIERLLDLHLEGELSKPMFRGKNLALAAREAELVEAIAQMAAASANARMLTKTRRALFSRRTLPLSAAVEVKRELGDIFDALELEDQRALLAATARVMVGAGQGMSRFTITGDGLPADNESIYSNAEEE